MTSSTVISQWQGWDEERREFCLCLSLLCGFLFSVEDTGYNFPWPSSKIKAILRVSWSTFQSILQQWTSSIILKIMPVSLFGVWGNKFMKIIIRTAVLDPRVHVDSASLKEMHCFTQAVYMFWKFLKHSFFGWRWRSSSL